MDKVERRSPETKKKRKASLSGNGEEDENGVESLDWWTKYHASVETAIKVRHYCGVALNNTHTHTHARARARLTTPFPGLPG